MYFRLFWRVSAILAALHLAWLMIARLFGVEFDISGLVFDAFGLVLACRHVRHEMT
jgi:hypothetical protein